MPLAIFGIVLIFVFYLLFEDRRNKKLLNTVTHFNRGTSSERKLVIKLLKSGIHSKAIFHDLYVKKTNGSFSQIDLVVATKVGLIVIEVKDYSGWIFGTGYKDKWTQVLAYGKKKYRFYNPVLQNKKHIEDLKNHTAQFQQLPFFSVIVFFGDCEFKDVSFIPEGTYLIKAHHVNSVIKAIVDGNSPANYIDKREVVKVLKAAVKNGENESITKQHVGDIKNMLGKHRIFD